MWKPIFHIAFPYYHMEEFHMHFLLFISSNTLLKFKIFSYITCFLVSISRGDRQVMRLLKVLSSTLTLLRFIKSYKLLDNYLTSMIIATVLLCE